MKTLIAANWKMHGDSSWLDKPAQFREIYVKTEADVEILICPPNYLILPMVAACKVGNIHIGAQNCHDKVSGAFTGEMSAAMASDAGASYVIVGHSERRAMFGETNAIVARKAHVVLEAGLIPIICVGEGQEERESGQADEVVGAQLVQSIPHNAKDGAIVIAYEPVWAIGTGLVPTLEDIAAMHDHIRGILSQRLGAAKADAIRILYGGSVKPSNADDILALSDVNGALIGGASLDMQSFAAIASAVKV